MVYSLLMLLLVDPFSLFCVDAAISDSVAQLGRHLHQTVGCPEDPLVLAASVPYNNLTAVFVGHHHGGLGQSAPESQWMVPLQRFLHHARVQVVSLLECVSIEITKLDSIGF
jgi:hypothetical protein